MKFEDKDVRPTFVEDLAEPIVAWRGWRTLFDGRLRSSLFRDVWTREMVAECHCPLFVSDTRKCPEVPGRPHDGIHYDAKLDRLVGRGFGCGLYAMKTREGLAKEYGHLNVQGQVELGGRVWEHAGGYRAQYARVIGLLDPRFNGRNNYEAVCVAAAELEVPLIDLEGKIQEVPPW